MSDATLILLFGVVAFLAVVLFRTSRSDARLRTTRIAEARDEIASQMAAVADAILELEGAADVPDADAHYREAALRYAEAERRLAEAATWADLDALSDDLDEARWHLAAAGALVDGRPEPVRLDTVEPCFFDPTHGAGTEVVELRTSAGARNVLVCAADAAELRRGGRPEPRPITVGGRSVPAPRAPRSYGGRGLDELDELDVFIDGMATHYRWGSSRRRRR